MSDESPPPDLEALLAVCLDGSVNESQLRQVEELVADSPEALAAYVEMMSMHAMLQWRYSPQADSTSCGLPVRDSDPADSEAEEHASPLTRAAQALLPPIVIDQGPFHPPATGAFAPGSALFSYSVASLVMIVGLVVGWCVTVARHAESTKEHQQDVAKLEPSPLPGTATPAREEKPVGRITGMVDCRWAESCSLTRGTRVSTGQRLRLAAGLVEVTYDSGAKVLLQGPANYLIDSEDSGYLSIGRLTARVEQQPLIVARDKSRIAPADATNSNGSPLFAVRTPRAVITDLGTEFAVEVSKGGACKAQVFQGKVEVRLKDAPDARPALLKERESVRVDVGRDGKAVMTREHGHAVQPIAYVRRLPKQVPIKLSNTGFQLKEGDFDPHWQVVARSDDPNFTPQQALVIGSDSRHKLVNTSSRPSWQVSLSSKPLPNNVRYTFRATFDLTGLDPASAEIHGSILADDIIVAVRLNGHRITEDRIEQANAEYLRFWAAGPERLVPGLNVMEVDVLNQGHPLDASPEEGIVACGVLWEGSAKELWNPAEKPSAKPPSSGL